MTLAILGGSPVRTKLFPAHRTIGPEEVVAVTQVLESGVLSKFLGAWHADFAGGPQVRAAEEEWAARFGLKHAISVNSNTSGLIAAVGAIGIQPGDEVIVSPYSMSISAVAPMFYGGVPVFADVERDTFCLDAASVASKITSRTRAIIVVDLFGQPYDVEGINALAREHGLKVIEDCAQAPGATFNGRCAGGLGDVGVFSLNYHKHIHSGEGGFIVTNDDEIADRCRLIRNHAESVVGPKGTQDLTNMLGFNFRMTEIEAAISRTQLRKLDALLERRLDNIAYIERKLAGLPALHFAPVRRGASHVYYQHAAHFDAEAAGIDRNTFIDAVKAELPNFELRETEGVKLGYGYVRPIYRQPIFSAPNYPSLFTANRADYSEVSLPVVERLHHHDLVTHEFMVPSMSHSDLDDVIHAFEKVWENRHLLHSLSK
jgi:Predicted pyridoxal phosphate-dependent enzyme apparently involved in regulation of cell wall biogenesis